MLAQALPELFATSDVAPVAPFAAQIAELLRTRSPRRDPRIVLLCRGEDNQSYFEESFLGRNLGIPMVQPADLLVREGRVFLKTIRGLEQVDVIYRRIESSSIDPIAFGYSRFQGVPGLVNCVRKGTVAIVNAIGSGVADNRAILRYSDRIITHYLHERPLLKTVPPSPAATGTKPSRPPKPRPHGPQAHPRLEHHAEILRRAARPRRQSRPAPRPHPPARTARRPAAPAAQPRPAFSKRPLRLAQRLPAHLRALEQSPVVLPAA